MDGQRRCSIAVGVLLLLLLYLVAGAVKAAEEEARCSVAVRSWAESQLVSLSSLPTPRDRHKLRDLLFFLHVPRTGGRTFNQCFLAHLFALDERCPRSYDKLRIDRSQPGCRLVSAHDDFSLVGKLANDVTSVVTAVRDPVNRVLSTYEFAIEVAARSLKQPLKGSRSSLPKSSSVMSTLNIWPWKYLVPTMQDDLFARRDKRLAPGLSQDRSGRNGGNDVVSVNGSYDAAALVMPFREFIHHSEAYELVHNGATFQVAGLTNTSYLEEAGEIRTCVMRFPHLGKHVLEVAKKRLDSMMYVGLTEKQRDSAEFMTKVVGGQVSTEHLLRSLMNQKSQLVGNVRRNVSRNFGPPVGNVPYNFTNLDDLTEEDVMEIAMQSYDSCVARIRRGHAARRTMSLDFIRPIKFSKEMREFIPKDVIEDVLRLNSLDAELYSHAQRIFAEQEEFLQQGEFHFSIGRDAGQLSHTRKDIHDGKNLNDKTHAFKSLGEISMPIFRVAFSVLSMAIMALVAVICLVAKRRGLRVKET